MQTHCSYCAAPAPRVWELGLHWLSTPLTQVTLGGQRAQAVPLRAPLTDTYPGKHTHCERLLALLGEVELGGHLLLWAVWFAPGHQYSTGHAPHSPEGPPKVPGLQWHSEASDAPSFAA
jgi:hypothetical protein